MTGFGRGGGGGASSCEQSSASLVPYYYYQPHGRGGFSEAVAIVGCVPITDWQTGTCVPLDRWEGGGDMAPWEVALRLQGARKEPMWAGQGISLMVLVLPWDRNGWILQMGWEVIIRVDGRDDS